MSLQLEVGKVYRNGAKELVHIVAHRTPALEPGQPFVAEDGQVYSENGAWMAEGNGPSIMDLVEEVPGIPQLPAIQGTMDTRAEQIQRLAPYFAGVALGRKDVNGQLCPAVIHDGDNVLCLFTGSNGTAQAHLFADLLNYLVDALPAQAAIDAVADRGTAVTDAPHGFVRAWVQGGRVQDRGHAMPARPR